MYISEIYLSIQLEGNKMIYAPRHHIFFLHWIQFPLYHRLLSGTPHKKLTQRDILRGGRLDHKYLKSDPGTQPPGLSCPFLDEFVRAHYRLTTSKQETPDSPSILKRRISHKTHSLLVGLALVIVDWGNWSKCWSVIKARRIPASLWYQLLGPKTRQRYSSHALPKNSSKISSYSSNALSNLNDIPPTLHSPKYAFYTKIYPTTYPVICWTRH